MPIISISGQSGSGKSKVAQILAERYEKRNFPKKAIWIPRATSRPMRPGEETSKEKVFFSNEELRDFGPSAFIPGSIEPLPDTSVPGWRMFFLGSLHINLWPEIPPDADFIIGVFGESAPMVKRVYLPSMITFYIKVGDKQKLLKRVLERSEELGIGFQERWILNEKYEELGEEKKYDHVVYNDGTPEECAIAIEEILNKTLKPAK